MNKPDIYQRTMIDVLKPDLKKLTKHFYTLQAFILSGNTRDDGFAGKGDIPVCRMERNSVYKTTEEKGVYNHHSALTKWKGKYWFAWSNGFINEEFPGQRTLLACSEDARVWSEPAVIADGDKEKGMLRNLGGLYPTENKLYALIQEKWDLVHAVNPDMSAHDNTKCSFRFDLHETEDGISWKITSKDHLGVMWAMEPPRLTKEGRLMCPASTHELKPAVLLWPGIDPAQKPEIIPIPYHGKFEAVFPFSGLDLDRYYEGHDEGMFLYGEASWFYDEYNRIWLWERDESGSGVLGVTISEDHGHTWTEIIRSNFPDSMSRIAAGRLSDGRRFLVGNSTYQYMDRNFFSISLSDDGIKFNRMLRLIPETTHQRFPGHLKVHGYQYPSCLVEENRLLIGYSVNKEDIEVGIIDTSNL